MNPRSYLAVIASTAVSAMISSMAQVPSAMAQQPTTGLTFRLTADPATLDWNLARTSHETYLIMNLMEGLVEEGPDLKPRAALAERWEVSPDGKNYTFYLRGGAVWSDGRSLRAQDFVDSWLRLLAPSTRSPYASFLFAIENAEAYHSGKLKDASKVGVRALGDSKLEVRLSRVTPYFLHIPTFWVTFPVRLDALKKHELVTLGPYSLSEWKRGEFLRLVRNPRYYGKNDGPSEVRAVVVPDDHQARELFDSGKLDFLLDATTQDLMKASLKEGGGEGRVEQFPYLATYYLGFNLRSKVLRESSIRRALAIAVDKDTKESIPSVLQGGQVPAPCWIPEGVEGAPASALCAHVSGSLYDAKGTLAHAGYVEGRGFPKLKLAVEKFDGAEKLAELLAHALHDKLGIDVQTHVASTPELTRELESGGADLFVGHWGADYPDAANFLEVFASGSGTNYTGWKSVEYDRFLEQARETLDPASRAAAFRGAEALLIDRDVAIVPLFHKRNTVLLGKRVREFRISPLNYLFFKDLRVGN